MWECLWLKLSSPSTYTFDKNTEHWTLDHICISNRLIFAKTSHKLKPTSLYMFQCLMCIEFAFERCSQAKSQKEPFSTQEEVDERWFFTDYWLHWQKRARNQEWWKMIVVVIVTWNQKGDKCEKWCAFGGDLNQYELEYN